MIVEGNFLHSDNTGLSYDVTNDGQSILMVRLKEELLRFSEFVVVYDWFDELNELVPIK